MRWVRQRAGACTGAHRHQATDVDDDCRCSMLCPTRSTARRIVRQAERRERTRQGENYLSSPLTGSAQERTLHGVQIADGSCGRECVKRCVVAQNSDSAQWPNNSRLVEAICIKLSQILLVSQPGAGPRKQEYWTIPAFSSSWSAIARSLSGTANDAMSRNTAC